MPLLQPMNHDGATEIPQAGAFGSLLVQLAGLAFRRAKSEEEDDKDVRQVVHSFLKSLSG